MLSGGAGTNALDGGEDTDLFVFDTATGAAHFDKITPSFAEIVFTFEDVVVLSFAEIVFTLTGPGPDPTAAGTLRLSDLDTAATSLADFDAAVLADLGMTVSETANGSALLDFGGGERMRINGLGLAALDPDRIVLTERPLGEAIDAANTLFGEDFRYTDPWLAAL